MLAPPPPPSTRRRLGRLWLWPAIVLALGLVSALGLGLALQAQEVQAMHDALEQDANRTRERLHAQLDERMGALRRMAHRWASNGTPPLGSWESDAKAYLSDFGDIDLMVWVDPTLHARWLVPLLGNEASLGVDVARVGASVSDMRRRDAALRARDRHQPTMSQILTLQTGAYGFGLFLPIYHDGAFEGLIVGRFEMQRTLERLLASQVRERFRISVVDADTILLALPGPEAAGPTWRFPVSPLQPQLQLQLQATLPTLHSMGSRLPMAVMLAGIGLSLLAAAAAYWALLARARARALGRTVSLQKGILDGAQQSVFCTDLTGTIVTFNAGAEAMLGYTAAQVLGLATPLMFHDAAELAARARELGDVWGELVPADCNALIRPAQRQGNETRTWTHIRQDGSRLPVLLTISAIRDNQGAIFQYLWIGVDISLAKKTEAELIRARDAAEAASQARTSFLALISHEIRTPLNGIIGMTGLLLDTVQDPIQRRYTEIVQSSGSHLLTLINDILDLSKIEAGKLTLEALTFDLRALIEAQTDTFLARAREKKSTLHIDLDPNLPPLLRGDPVRIGQILLNLISNAVKFTVGGHITVSARCGAFDRDGATIQMRVSDSGIGMNEEQQTRLFEPFAQADSSTARRYGGTGLGLSICKRLVDLMQGTIGVESQPDTGSTFWFDIRLQRDEASTQAGGGTHASLVDLHALVVDDDLVACNILQVYMAAWGMRVSLAHTSALARQQVLDALAGPAPCDVVLLNMHLPDGDGIALSTWIHAQASCSALPMLFIATSDPPARGSLPPASASLLKPVHEGELHRALLQICAGRKPGRAQPPALAALPSLTATAANTRAGTLERRILVAEDNQVNQLLVMTLLRQFGYTAEAVKNGQEALDALRRASFDLVLMDCQMPEMDGFQATAAIRAQEASCGGHIPIVALTANAMPEDQDRCMHAGMDAYLPKPIQRDRLAQTLKQWLGQP